MANSLKESYDEIFKKIAVMLNLVRLNIFKKSFKKREALFILMDLQVFAVILSYSMWYFREDYLRVAVCIVPSFYSVQVRMLTLYIYMLYFQYIYIYFNFYIRYYLRYTLK